MATGFSDKAPPLFNARNDDFGKWERKFNLWKQITDVAAVKQGALLVLRLDDDTQDTILELISTEDLNKADGVDKVVNHLKEIFKKDESIAAFDLYEEFEAYRRPADMSITTFCSEFQKRLSKVKASGTTLSEHVLAFRLLKSANLSEGEEQLFRFTITKMDYDNMVNKLNKLVGCTSSQVHSDMSTLRIKEEKEDATPTDTYYAGRYSNRRGRLHSYNDQPRSERNFSDAYSNHGKPMKQRGGNALDPCGNITRCRICDSINHWEKRCPDKVY